MSEAGSSGEYIGQALAAITEDKEQLDRVVQDLRDAIEDLESFMASRDDFYGCKPKGRLDGSLDAKLSRLRDGLSLVYAPLLDQALSDDKDRVTPAQQPPNTQVIINEPGDRKPKTDEKNEQKGLAGVIAQYVSKRISKPEDDLDRNIVDIGRSLQKRLNSIRSQHSIYQSLFLYFGGADGKGRRLKTQLLKSEIKEFCDLLEPYAKACASYIDGKMNEASMRIAEAQARTLQAISYMRIERPYAEEGYDETDLTGRRRR